MQRSLALLASTLVLHGCATTYRITPVDNPPATVRYDRGAPTTSLVQRNGAVQVTPLSYNADGKMAFAIAAYNSANWVANFGVENVEARTSDKGLRIYTADDLVREARNEAIAASVTLALLGVAAAAASQAAARQTYNSTLYTPRGAYHYRATYYDGAAAAAGTAASIGAAGAGIYAVQQSLDAAIAGIGQTILQTTTVDPGVTVAGRVMVQKPGGRSFPKDVQIVVRWNDETYPFRFAVSKSDGSTPPSSVRAPAPEPPPVETLGSSVPDESDVEAPPSNVSLVREQQPAPVSAPRPIQKSPQPTKVRAVDEQVESDEEYNARMWREQAGSGR